LTKSLFFGCSVAVLSCPAFAQSSVTLYGSVDVGVDYVTNSRGGHLIQESAGKRTPDRFGFRIVEDLGGGNKVVVRLENGFLTNTEIPKAQQMPPELAKASLVGRREFMAACVKIAQAKLAEKQAASAPPPESQQVQTPPDK